MKNILCVAFVVFSMDCVGQQFKAATIEQIKSGVVPIVCVGQRPNTSSPYSYYVISIEGTGIIVGDGGAVVTAGHVAKGIFAQGRIPVCAIQAVYIPTNGWKPGAFDFDLSFVGITRCWWDDDIDAGICKLATNPLQGKGITVKPRPIELSAEFPKEGEAIAFTGFPLNVMQPITSQGTIGALQGSPGKSLGAWNIVIDKNAWPGASGSPAYTTDGRVVGLLIQRGTDSAAGLAFVRTSPYILKFLSDSKGEREKDAQASK
jgi:hypothetical protein